MKRLLGNTLEDLKFLCREYGFPSFTAQQIAQWLYQKKVHSIDEMTNISKECRELLKKDFQIGREIYIESVSSVDGTRKYLFPVGVETVMIPEEERCTLCVSSQIGCKMGCKFCMTGRSGFHGQLSAGEIISQIIDVDEQDHVTNIVFMGMGEPLDNWPNVKKAIEILTAPWGFAMSPKRITVSTIGASGLKSFLDECSCHLAISLHNPYPEERALLMPMEKAFPIEETIDLIRHYDFSGQRRVSFEYIMFSGVNDTKHHADRLAMMLRGIECRVNLIRFHRIPDSELAPSPGPVIDNFKKRLNDAGILTTLRASRGEDILAACGMLSGQHHKTV